VFKFKDEYKTRVAVCKMGGYPTNYVTDFVKDHKKKRLAWAQELRVCNPASIAWKKWSEEREKEIEKYRARKAEEDARKAAEEAERAEMQGLNDTITSLCVSESFHFWKSNFLFLWNEHVINSLNFLLT